MSKPSNKAKAPDQDAEQTEDTSPEKNVEVPDRPVDTEASEEQNTSPDQLNDETQEQLIEMLLAARAQIEEMKDGYVRSRADVENIQRRSRNEVVAARKYAVEGFARELLSVVDSLDQASKVELDDFTSEAVNKMKEGLELTLRQFEKVMDKFGVTAIEADTGTKFNPDFHQAISMVDNSDVDSGHIVTVMQKGFGFKDRLLRPAMVVIAK